MKQKKCNETVKSRAHRLYVDFDALKTVEKYRIYKSIL